MRLSVQRAMLESFEHFGNPSSIHALGRKARAMVEDARESVAKAINASSAGVVFTSGGTEANNLAISSFARMGAQCLVSSIEHESVIAASNSKERIAVNADGIVDLQQLERTIAEVRSNDSGPLLVAVMLANNETGVVQPINEVIAIAKHYKAYVHCDAVQGFGKLDVDFQAMGVDSVSLSAHKIGGPKGVGALIVNEHLDLAPLIKGSGQERGMRSGTEGVTNIVGFQVAIQDAMIDDWKPIEVLRDFLEKSLQNTCSGLKIYGCKSSRLPNTSCIVMPGVAGQQQLMSFDLQGIAVSVGAACSSGKAKASHVLQGMGVDAREAGQALRVSLGWDTKLEHIEEFIRVWTNIYLKHCKEAA